MSIQRSMEPRGRTGCFSGPTRTYWGNLKLTVISVWISTGSPLSRYGLYFHCLTASVAALVSCGFPLSAFTCVMSPVLEIVACNSTAPSIRMVRALVGYAGWTFFINNPRDTPCETFSVCRIGLGALPAPLTRSGGGAPAPVAAIPIMLGAGASAAADVLCAAAAVPPLTTRGAASGFASSAGLSAADEVELECFVELGAADAASSEAASVSSVVSF